MGQKAVLSVDIVAYSMETMPFYQNVLVFKGTLDECLKRMSQFMELLSSCQKNTEIVIELAFEGGKTYRFTIR